MDRVAARPLHGRGDVGPAAPAGDGHSGRPRTGSVSVWIALLVAGALVLAACTSGSPGPSTTSPASDATATPPSPADVAKRQALAAYQAMWADMVVAARTADYKSPLLPQHAAGAALSTLVRGLYTDKRLGVVVKGHPVFHPRVVGVSPSANPTKVQIVDCLDGRHWLTYKVTGGLQNNVPGGLHHTTATVTDMNGVWKVTKLLVEAVGTCQEPSSSP